MATVKGQNLRIYIEGKAIGAALECSLQVQLDMQQRSTKDDEGDWARNSVVNINWSVTASAAVTDIDYVEAVGASDLMELIGQQVEVELATAGGTQNREKGDILLAGTAILSDVQVTAENRRRGTFTIQLTGCRNLLNELRYLVSSDNHLLVSSNEKVLMAEHEA